MYSSKYLVVLLLIAVLEDKFVAAATAQTSGSGCVFIPRKIKDEKQQQASGLLICKWLVPEEQMWWNETFRWTRSLSSLHLHIQQHPYKPNTAILGLQSVVKPLQQQQQPRLRRSSTFELTNLKNLKSNETRDQEESKEHVYLDVSDDVWLGIHFLFVSNDPAASVVAFGIEIGFILPDAPHQKMTKSMI